MADGGSTTTAPPRGAVLSLIVFVVLTGLVQSSMVVPGLGAAGRPAALFALALLALWGFTRLLPSTGPGALTPIRRALLIYLSVFLAAMAAGIDRGLPGVEQRAMDRAFLITLGLGAVVLVAEEGLRSVDDVERVLSWAVAIGAIGAVVGVIQFLGLDLTTRLSLPGLVPNTTPGDIATRGDVGYRRVRGFALHPIEYGVHLAMLLPVAIHLAMHRTDLRRLRWVAVGLLAAGIPLSISRSSFLALAVAMGVFAVGFTWRQRANLAAIAVGGTLAFMIVTPGLLGTIRSLFLNAGNDDSVAGRTGDYAHVGELIAERPILGRGPGTFVPERYRVLDNQLLATLLETGWLGLAALALVLVAVINTSIRLVRRSASGRTRSLARALGANAVLAPVVFATFDALGFPIFAGTLILMIGCLAALDRIERTPEVGDPSPVARHDHPVPA